MQWSALFGQQSVPSDIEASDPLLARALEAAVSQIGVMEDPPGSNRGTQVDAYLRAVGLNPAGGSFAWCAAFIYFCFDQAANAFGRKNPLIRTAGVLDHWNKAGKQGISRRAHEEVVNNPALIKPGHIFVMDFGTGKGHTGIVEPVGGGKLVTIN